MRKHERLESLLPSYDVTFIVNDHIDIALDVEADGVHLGQDDLPLKEARKIMGNKIIGFLLTGLKRRRQAEAEGADYIGVGPVFATQTKEDVTDPVTTEYVREVANEITIPFVAIGGIKLHNVDQVLAAGAERICAVSEIVGSQDVAGTCRAVSCEDQCSAGGEAAWNFFLTAKIGGSMPRQCKS